MTVSAADMQVVSELVEELCGIVLDSTKGYLVENRFGHMLGDYGCDNYQDLVAMVRSGGNKQLPTALVDAITTNETLFFRDQSPFEALRHKVLPELFDAKEKTPYPQRLRIWSVACSTGQEPYSMAMVLSELLEEDFPGWDIQILATDICEDALDQAREGVYGDLEIRRGLSTGELNRHFIPEGDSWRIKPELQKCVRFEKRNLLDPFAGIGRFDVIFCRNVAIYFKQEVRADLYKRLADRMGPGGYLFTSSSESLQEVDERFSPQLHCRSVFYRPAGL